MRLEDHIAAIPTDEKLAACELIRRQILTQSLKARIKGALDLIVDYMQLSLDKHEFFNTTPDQIVRECMHIYSVTSEDMALIPDLWPDRVMKGGERE